MYIVIDIEATKNDEKWEIIELAIVLIKNNEIKQTYTTLISPETTITPYITSLTNISNEDVENAPTFTKIAQKTKDLIQDYPIIGHNVSFDIDMLNKAYVENGFTPLRNETIDTVELTKILFPTIDKLRLQKLAKRFQLTHKDPHRALSDAVVTAQLFLKLKDKLFHLPLQTKKHLIQLVHTLQSDLSQLFYKAKQTQLKNNKDNLIKFNGLNFKDIFNVSLNKKNKLDESFGYLCDTIFNTKNDHSIESPKLEYRKHQQHISEEIYECFQLNHHGLIEASAGSGKTIAYLLPSIYKAVKNNETIVISTEKVNLQLQIMEEALPKLQKMLPFHFIYTSLRGKGHYLSLEQFNHQLKISETNYNKNILKAMILVWITETKTGDMNELNLPDDLTHYVKQISALNENDKSLWQQYSYYNETFKRANQSHIVVVNHALLSNDIHLKNNLIPLYDKLIIDEAHHFPDIAEDQFSITFNFQYIFNMLKKNRVTINNESKYDKLQLQAQHHLLEFFRYISLLMERHDATDFIIINELKGEKIWRLINDMVNRVIYSINELIHFLQREESHESNDLNRLKNIEQQLNEFSDRSLINQHLISFKMVRQNNKRNIFGQKQKKEMPKILHDKLFTRKKSVILMSATLTVNESFAYMRERLGLTSQFSVAEKIFSSPFNIEEQTKLMVPSDFPDVKEDHFLYVVTEAILSLIHSLHGNILVLFTSHQMLTSVYYLLEELIGLQYNLIAQNITHNNYRKLVKQFQTMDNSVLLGTNALWEGVDIPGENLKCLIIVKLPFDHPHHTKQKLKQKELEQKGRNSFYHYTLPRMILRLKQGMGRLIRTHDDKGVIFVLDHRLYTSSYRDTILSSIRNYPLTYDSIKTLVSKTEKWLK